MAKKYLSPLNLVNLSADPSGASEGDIYWNSLSNTIRVYYNNTWSDITPAGQENSLTNVGIKTNNVEGSISGIENTTTIDTADETVWRTLKYLLQIKYSGESHASEVIVSNDSTDLLMSQYGDIYTSTPLATITSDKNSGIINLKVTPISGKSPISVRFFRIGIKV